MPDTRLEQKDLDLPTSDKDGASAETNDYRIAAVEVCDALKIDIHEISSYGLSSKPVQKMAASHAAGRPLAMYEIMQGMVDYGKNHAIPPRISFVLVSGETVVFNGRNAPRNATEIAAIEFENHGPGLSPEDTVIDMHDAREATLGEHGHGTTIALSYLESIGVHTTITSNYKGRNWQGKSNLQDTTTRKTKVLHIDGAWGEPCLPEQQKTIFRIENPPQNMCDDLQKIPDLFLFANPNYPRAIIVPVNDEVASQVQAPHPLDCGEVECLAGVVPAQEAYNFIYVDGVKIPLGNRQSILPWHVQNLKNSKLHQVERSTDSTEVNGDLKEVIPAIVRDSEDRAMLSTILKRAVDNPAQNYLELAHSYFHPGFKDATKALLKAIWTAEYEGALIDCDAQRIAEADLADKKILLVSEQLYAFLERAGVTTLLAEKGAVSHKIQYLNSLCVPEADKPQSLDSLIERIAMNGGYIDIVDVGGAQQLRIKLPHAVTSAAEFRGETQYIFGNLVRVGAIIADQQGIDAQIFSIDNTSHTIIKIAVKKSPYLSTSDSFETDITTEQYPIGAAGEFLGYEADRTYILLSGTQINTFEQPTRLQLLVEQFLQFVANMGKSAADFTLRRKGGRTFGGNSFRTPEAISHTTVDRTAAIDGQVGQVGMPFEPGSTVAPGNYGLETGSRLSFAGGELAWTSECQWTEIAVPRKSMGRKNLSLVKRDLNGETRLTVKSDHAIVAHETIPDNAQVKFYYDSKNGSYSVLGEVAVLTVYTAENKKKNSLSRPPLAEEVENPIRDYQTVLASHWRDLLSTVEANTSLSPAGKAMLIAQAWHDRFKHQLGSQLLETTKNACAMEIVNRCAGDYASYASGLAVLLRSNGIASKVVSGYLVDQNNRYQRQTWVEYFDGQQWHALASLTTVHYRQEDVPAITRASRDDRPYVTPTPRPQYREKAPATLKSKSVPSRPSLHIRGRVRHAILITLLLLGVDNLIEITSGHSFSSNIGAIIARSFAGDEAKAQSEQKTPPKGQKCELICR